jgi:hypothetical protein
VVGAVVGGASPGNGGTVMFGGVWDGASAVNCSIAACVADGWIRSKDVGGVSGGWHCGGMGPPGGVNEKSKLASGDGRGGGNADDTRSAEPGAVRAGRTTW